MQNGQVAGVVGPCCRLGALQRPGKRRAAGPATALKTFFGLPSKQGPLALRRRITNGRRSLAGVPVTGARTGVVPDRSRGAWNGTAAGGSPHW
jgi:hypothetical protein